MAEQASVSTVMVVFSAAPGCAETAGVTWTPGATVGALIDASGLPQRYPAFDFAQAQTGVWGKLVPRDAPVQVQDRIEIYRSLQVDPKVARARRASKKNKAKQAAAGSKPVT